MEREIYNITSDKFLCCLLLVIEIIHVDEFIDELLREERLCDVILPRIQVTIEQKYYYTFTQCSASHNVIQYDQDNCPCPHNTPTVYYIRGFYNMSLNFHEFHKLF